MAKRPKAFHINIWLRLRCVYGLCSYCDNQPATISWFCLLWSCKNLNIAPWSQCNANKPFKRTLRDAPIHWWLFWIIKTKTTTRHMSLYHIYIIILLYYHFHRVDVCERRGELGRPPHCVCLYFILSIHINFFKYKVFPCAFRDDMTFGARNS